MATKKKDAPQDGDANKVQQVTVNADAAPAQMTIITRHGAQIEIDAADWWQWRLRSARLPEQDEPEVKAGTYSP